MNRIVRAGGCPEREPVAAVPGCIGTVARSRGGHPIARSRRAYVPAGLRLAPFALVTELDAGSLQREMDAEARESDFRLMKLAVRRRAIVILSQQTPAARWNFSVARTAELKSGARAHART
jgi:hypothetical protein